MNKNLFLVAAVLVAVLIVFKVNANRNVSIKPIYTDTVPKEYTVSLQKKTWYIIDSLLKTAEYYVGRRLSVEEAEPLKYNIQAIANTLNEQLQKQYILDSVKAKPPVKK